MAQTADGTLTVPTTDPGDLAQANLARHAAQAAGAYARNTERALWADVAIFSAWCADQGLEPLPASPETVVAFMGIW